MSFEKVGFLSLWLFRSKRDSVDNSLLEDDFGIATFDEDMLEVGGSEDWQEISLEEAIAPMSYSESWRAEAIQRASELGIRCCCRAFIIVNFAYDPSAIKKSIPDDPIFVGVFKYNDYC